jgi:hypothetical protein
MAESAHANTYASAAYGDGIVTRGTSGGRSLTRPFRDARRFPSTSSYPYCTRTPRNFGICPSFTVFCRPVPLALRFATCASLYVRYFQPQGTACVGTCRGTIGAGGVRTSLPTHVTPGGSGCVAPWCMASPPSSAAAATAIPTPSSIRALPCVESDGGTRRSAFTARLAPCENATPCRHGAVHAPSLLALRHVGRIQPPGS